jgi:tetratricopeptide (TPR) repeat protein
MPLFGPNIKRMEQRGDIEGLVKELKNRDPKVRIEATKALSELKHVGGLIEASKNDNSEVRFEAVSALENVDETEAALAAVIDVLTTDENETVWQRAFEALSGSIVGEKWDIWASNVAMELLKKKRYQKAITCFEKAIEINQDKETIGSIGVTLIDYERYEEALKYFERYIEKDPNDARGWGGKGLALSNLNQNEEAINCCKKALEIDPKLKGARDTLSGCYYKKGDLEAYASLARQTLQFAPEDIQARLMLSEALALSNRLAEAESEAQKTLELVYEKEYAEPKDLGMIHQQLGIIYVMRGHGEKAMDEFKKAVQANQRDQWGYKLLDAYLILNMMGSAMDGTPLERRGKLLGYAAQRAKTYSTYAQWEAENM